MSETRKYCCCGLFSLEQGSVIIGIFHLLIAISALIGLICILEFGTTKTIKFITLGLMDNYYVINAIVFADIVLSLMFNSMLINGISKERSDYFLPWAILNILNIFACTTVSMFTIATKNLYLGICFVIFTILECYCLMVVGSTYDLISKKEKERSARGVVPGGAGGAMAHPDFGRSVNPISTRGADYAHLITTGTPGFSDLPTALSAQETSIEISVITPSAPSAPSAPVTNLEITNPRMQYLRSPSLPAYENVVSEQSTKNIETPPPNYNEIMNNESYV